MTPKASVAKATRTTVATTAPTTPPPPSAGGAPRPSDRILVALDEAMGDLGEALIGLRNDQRTQHTALADTLATLTGRVDGIARSLAHTVAAVESLAAQTAAERERLHEAYMELATAPTSGSALSDVAVSRIAAEVARLVHVNVAPPNVQVAQPVPPVPQPKAATPTLVTPAVTVVAQPDAVNTARKATQAALARPVAAVASVSVKPTTTRVPVISDVVSGTVEVTGVDGSVVQASNPVLVAQATLASRAVVANTQQARGKGKADETLKPMATLEATTDAERTAEAAHAPRLATVRSELAEMLAVRETIEQEDAAERRLHRAMRKLMEQDDKLAALVDPLTVAANQRIALAAAGPAPTVAPAAQPVRAPRTTAPRIDESVTVTWRQGSKGGNVWAVVNHRPCKTFMSRQDDGVTYVCQSCGHVTVVSPTTPSPTGTGSLSTTTRSVITPIAPQQAAPTQSRAERKAAASSRPERTKDVQLTSDAIAGDAPWNDPRFVRSDDGSHNPTVCIGCQSVAVVRGFRCSSCTAAHKAAKRNA